MLDPIIATQSGKVFLTYSELPDFNLELDFNPLIDFIHLRGTRFCMAHWQAKPFGQRRWGVYDSRTDTYSSLVFSHIDIQSIPQLLQIDETIIKTVPTAVLYFPRSKLIKNGYYSIISA